jgi:hypothetical protein
LDHEFLACLVGEAGFMVPLYEALEAEGDDDAAGDRENVDAEVTQGSNRVLGRMNVHESFVSDCTMSGAIGRVHAWRALG